jgi:predicted ArsR family transcriptional regulator
MSYPAEPGFKVEGTSREAAQSVRASQRIKNHNLIIEALLVRPRTADEVAEALELSVLYVRPRFSELREDGRIADSGARRANSSGRRAVVWKAVPIG